MHLVGSPIFPKQATNPRWPQPESVKLPYKHIILDEKVPISTITLNRPEKLNAMDFGNKNHPWLLEELEHAINHIRQNMDIRVVIIKGAGKAFSAGYDMSPEGAPVAIGPGELSAFDHYVFFKDWFAHFYYRNLWCNLHQFFIAQVHAFCLAGATDLAGFCDMTIASDDAVFGYPAGRTGAPSSVIWHALMGIKKATEWNCTGRYHSAQEALQAGMINKCVPIEKLDEEVMSVANSVAKMAPINLYLTKRIRIAYFGDMILKGIEAFGISGGMGHAGQELSFTNSPKLDEYFKIEAEQGLKTALDYRDSIWTEEDKIIEKIRTRKVEPME